MKQRQRQVAEQIKREVSFLLERRSRDERLKGVVVTQVWVALDYSYATLHYVLMDRSLEKESVQAALEGSRGFLRTGLSRVLPLYRTPALRFIFDDTTEQAERLEKLINDAMVVSEVSEND